MSKKKKEAPSKPARDFEDMRQYLRKKLTEAEITSLPRVHGVNGDPALRKEWEGLRSTMRPDDEVWSWDYSFMDRPRPCYGYGWCFIREGRIVFSYCIHSS